MPSRYAAFEDYSDIHTDIPVPSAQPEVPDSSTGAIIITVAIFTFVIVGIFIIVFVCGKRQSYTIQKAHYNDDVKVLSSI